MKCILPGKLLTNSIDTYYLQYFVSQHFTRTLSSLCFISLATAGFLFYLSSAAIAQIEVAVGGNISSPIFNSTLSENAHPSPAILYSALNKDTIVGEVLNNFSYSIEQVRITAIVYDMDGVIIATGDKYVNDYLMQPGSRSGFDIFLDETLPSKSKYTLTTSYEKSNDIKPEALELSVGRDSKTSNSFRVLGEVMNQGNSSANGVKVSAIFYDQGHKVIDTDYVYTNPDIITPNKKAPFEFSFHVNNPEKIKYMAFNVQSDEYSLMINNQSNYAPQL